MMGCCVDLVVGLALNSADPNVPDSQNCRDRRAVRRTE